MTVIANNNNNNNNNINIIVVGCGMTGLAMALSLSKQEDTRVEIIEKRSCAFEQKGSAFGLAPNGQKAMAEISPKVLEHCHLAGIPMPNGSLLLPWFEVRDALLEECRTRDNITIRTGINIANIDQSSPLCVAVSFEDSDLVLHADAVIGADGVHSKVRTILGLEPALGLHTTMWRGCIDVDKPDSKLKHLPQDEMFQQQPFLASRIGKTILMKCNFHSKRPGIVGWIVSTHLGNVPPGSTPGETLRREEQALEEGPAQESQKKSLQEWHRIFAESEERDLRWTSELCVTPLPLYADLLQATKECDMIEEKKVDGVSQSFREGRWGGQDRITLIGDAAHAIRPTSGLGGALGMEDVVILTKMLASRLGENHSLVGSEMAQVFREFEQKRVPRVVCIAEEQAEQGQARRRFKTGGLPAWSKSYEEWVYNPDLTGDATVEYPLEEVAMQRFYDEHQLGNGKQ